MDKQIKLGQVLEEKDIITPDEVKEFNEFEKTISQMQRATTKKKAQAKTVQELIDAHKMARKWDKQSVHTKIEGHLALNGLDRGRAFGGKFNGKDARKAI